MVMACDPMTDILGLITIWLVCLDCLESRVGQLEILAVDRVVE
jgi:hypothetical protein